jgi:predicted O-methyltransferase YrrM
MGATFTFVNFMEFNKYGVDPSPQIEHSRVVKKTSDDFFKLQHEGTAEDLPKSYDVVFIDGMHQLEYILRDFNNALRVLNYEGIVLFDDIIPWNEKVIKLIDTSNNI